MHQTSCTPLAHTKGFQRQKFLPKLPLHQNPFAPEDLQTNQHLQKVFTARSFHVFTPEYFYTRRLLHRKTLTPEAFHTKQFYSFHNRLFYTRNLWHPNSLYSSLAYPRRKTFYRPFSAVFFPCYFCTMYPHHPIYLHLFTHRPSPVVVLHRPAPAYLSVTSSLTPPSVQGPPTLFAASPA